MKTILSILFALFICTAHMSFAASEKSYQLVEELLVLNNVKGLVDNMKTQMKQMVVSQIETMGLPEDQAKHVENIQKITTDILWENLSWEKMKGDYIELYVNTFSEEELNGIVAFSKSSIGRKLAEKTPILMQKSMLIGQKQAQLVMPQVLEAIQEYIEKNKLQ